MDHLPPILILLAVFLLLLGLAVLGWRRRAARQGAAGLPAPLPAGDGAADAAEEAAGVYVATTSAQDHLDRITAHGLGARSRVRVRPADGAEGRWEILREGARSYAIPAADLAEITTAPGMVGKWMGGDALLILRWRLGGTLVDTGIRLDSRDDHDRLLALDPTARAAASPASAPISRKETP